MREAAAGNRQRHEVEQTIAYRNVSRSPGTFVFSTSSEGDSQALLGRYVLQRPSLQSYMLNVRSNYI